MNLSSIFSGHRPDITPAQVVGAVFGAIGPVAALLGLHLSQVQVDAANDLKVLALGLVAGDAAIRIGRNVKDGKVEAAALSSTNEPVDKAPADNAGIGAEKVEPIEAPLDPDEVEAHLGTEVSSDPEADAVDLGELPTDEEEATTELPRRSPGRLDEDPQA